MVQWHDERERTIWMFESDLAAALANLLPANLAQGTDQLRAGDDWKSLGYAGMGRVRRTIPVTSD